MTMAALGAGRRSGARPGEEEAHPPAPRRTRWWVDVAVIVWLLWVYDLTTNLAPLRQGAAIRHGRDILHLEATLHLDPERTLDHWLIHHHTLALWLSDYYDNAHFAVTLIVIGWLWWRHAGPYRRLRLTLVLSNLIAFVVFWLDPTAPPRMLPGAHIGDVVAASGAFGSWHSGGLASDANQLAAMPSLHLAWAGWCALAVWVVWRHRSRWVALVWLYPALTLFAVLATGNHYLADTLAGLATLGVSYAVACLLQPRVGAWFDRRWPRRRSWLAQRVQRRRRRQPSGKIESMTSSTVTAPTKRSASSHTATLTKS